MATEILTHAEAKRLVFLEEDIGSGIETFLKVGSALLEIQENKLYRSHHSTFEAYCEDQWQMSGRRARQLTRAAKITECLEIGTRVPISEVQVRPLSQVAEEARSEVWNEAVAEAGDKPPTMKQVQAAVDKKLGKPKKPKGQSLVNGVLQDDPPEIAKQRAKGLIAEGVIPDITTVNEGGENVKGVAEERDERSAIQADTSDEAWLASLPLSAQLTGYPLNLFQDDAVFYRNIEPARKAFGKKVAELLNKSRRKGAYGNRIQLALSCKPPSEWKACAALDVGGCGGTGQIKTIGQCSKCFGRGYWIL